MRLVYLERRSDGIFGGLYRDGEDAPFAVFVTHAYRQDDGTYLPKVRAGQYDCLRSMHRLDGMTEDFETFEVTGVEGHDGILFHWGNWGSDSKGCFCLGDKVVRTELDRDGIDGPDEMVTKSRDTFKAFMLEHASITTFPLKVEENFASVA